MPSVLPENEKLLLKRVAEGDEEAFACFFHAYRDKLFSFIYRLSGSKEMAEDILQDVFLKIWIQRERLTGIENCNAFLFRVSQNHAINHLRRMSKETLILIQTQEQRNKFSPAPDEQMTLKNIRQSLNEIISRLPPQQKAVYRLSREEHLKQEEIARQLHISVSTVKNHMTQALRTIRKGLEKYYPGMVVVIGLLSSGFFT